MLLKLHKDWKGFYYHNGINYICNVHVLSESYVKFSSENINVDMRGKDGYVFVILDKQNVAVAEIAILEMELSVVSEPTFS